MSTQYVTVPLIAKWTKKSQPGVYAALRAYDLARKIADKSAPSIFEKWPGVRGVRIKLTDANDFIKRQWPSVFALKGALQLTPQLLDATK